MKKFIPMFIIAVIMVWFSGYFHGKDQAFKECSSAIDKATQFVRRSTGDLALAQISLNFKDYRRADSLKASSDSLQKLSDSVINTLER